MRVLCVLNGGPDHPSTRFRVLQHVEAWRRRGLTVDLLVAKRGEGYGLLTLRRRALDADVVLLQKKVLDPWKLRVLPRRVPLLFDFDDALFEATPDEEDDLGPLRAAKRARRRRLRLAATLARATCVIAGNRFLEAHACAVAERVTVVPTAVDLAPFGVAVVEEAAARRRARSAAPRIGWIGSRSSLRYLRSLAPALRAAVGRLPGARVVLICNDFVDLDGVPLEKRLWSAEREAADLLDLDVGLMPLDDRPFSRGKCGLKILQYQAAGVPVVCSPVGANRDIVRDGATGLFADGMAAWTEAVVRVATDPGLADRLSRAARTEVRERYAAPVIGARLATLFEETVRGAASGPGPGARAAASRDDLRQGAAPGEDAERQQQSRRDQRLLIPDHAAERPRDARASGVRAE